MSAVLASIPSPGSGVVELGPLRIHAYGITLLIAIAACVWLTGTRWVRRGGDWDLIFRVAVWGVAAGIVGARAYHVASSWDQVPDEWWGPFAIWEGGLSVWGGIGLGVIVGAIVVRRSGESVRALMDVVAPGLLLAQAIGRLGNWFNNELYGGPTDLPWGLTIHEFAGGSAVVGPDGQPVVLGTFHPTFLYELLWNLAAAALVVWADRRFRLGHGRAFALYVAAYCAGRVWIEMLRTDPAETFFGVRLNVFTSVVLGLLAVAYLIRMRGRPREVITRGERAAADDEAVPG